MTVRGLRFIQPRYRGFCSGMAQCPRTSQALQRQAVFQFVTLGFLHPLHAASVARGFEPGWNRRVFQGEKILSTPSFGGEVKPSVSCHRFAACKRSLKKAWKSLISAKFVGHFSPNSSTSRYCDLWRRCDVRDTWRCRLERLKTKGLQ